MQAFVLLGTSGCHLCAIAGDVVARSLDRLSYCVDVAEKDIADRDSLIAIYGTRIPVLRNEARNLDLDWPFTEDQVISFFAQR